MAQLRPHLPRIRSRAEVVAIGSGAPHFVQAFRQTTGFDGPVYCDPSLVAYRAAGLHRGTLRMLDPRGVVDLARALRHGARQGSIQGDARQLGGVLVVRPPDRLVYRYASRRPGDLAPIADLLAAVERPG